MKFKSNFNLSFLAFLFVTLTFFACKKDEGTNEPAIVETTVEEDKANIRSTLDNMLVCVDDMSSSRAIDVLLRDFLSISEGEVYNEDWSADLGEEFGYVFDFDHIDENQRFNLVHHAGWYSFNHDSGTWGKNPSTDNTITIQFPTSPDLTANNSIIVIDQYTDQLINIDGDEVYAPKRIHAYMNVDGEKVFELNLSDVTYDDNASFEIPVAIDASLFMAPMTIDLDVTRNSNTEFSGMLAFNDGSACRMSIEADLELADDDFENLTEESIEKVHAKVRLGDMTVQSLAGLADLFSMDDPTTAEVNSLLDLDVLFQDVKIADLDYDDDEENFVITYKDESSESAASYMDEFMTDLEALVTEFTGEW